MKKLFSIVASIALLAGLLPTNVLGATYSDELNGAYDYAYGIGITTQSSIDSANMYGNLIRSHMAKMMVNYAKEVLGKSLDTTATCNFTDIANESAEMKGYITEACQMGLMGVGITAFRPNDTVTRAEFGTVLSRALWGDTNNGGEPYYVNHLNALKEAGVMTNISNPTMKEVRGYVMLMMQRADESGVANDQPAICSTPENVLACSLGLDSCPAECLDTEEEEEEVIVETKAGTLTVDTNAGTPEGELPIGKTTAISRIPLLTFDVEADGSDIKMHNLTLEFLGYGDFADVDNVSVYNEENVKVSKTKNFTDEELTISFVNDYVVKKGGKETLTVVAEFPTTAEPNTTYGVSITDLDSSAEDTNGLPIEGNKMKGVVVTNQTVLDFTNAAVTENLSVGQEKKLAAFKLANEDVYEDVTIESITFQVDGVDGDILENLTVLADGQEVASDLEVVNGELVANMDYVLAKDTNDVEFELMGSVNAMDDDNIVITLEDTEAILAKGNKYGFNITSDIGAAAVTVGTITIEGSEVTVSFDKSDIDEAKPEAENVLLGTLKLKSTATDYTINSYSICVSTNVAEVEADEIKDLTLGGNSYDSLILDASTTACAAGYDEYVFEDISLPAGQQVSLQLVADFEDTVEEDDDLSVNVSFTQNVDVTDEDNDEDYTEANIGDIFSTTSFTAKSLTIQGATFTTLTTALNNRDVVLGNQEELVYKGKISIGDADAVTLKSINFTDAGTVADLTDVIQGATLTIDGNEYEDSDIEAGRIEFTNINHKFVAGKTNAIIELAVKFKTDDLGGANPTLILSTAAAEVDVVDSDGNDLVVANVSIATAASSTITLMEEGELTIEFEKDDETSTTMANFTEQDKYALAGSTEKVLLGKIKLSADREDMKVEKLTFKFDDVAGDFYNSYDNLYFSTDAGATVIGTNDVTYAANVTTVEYTFSSAANFVVSKATPKYGYLYATVKARNEDPNAAEAGAIDGASVTNLDVTAVEYKGLSSDLDEVDLVETLPATVAEDTTVVVNTIASVQLVEMKKTLANGTAVVGKLVVTPSTQTTNKDADGDILNALLGSVKLTTTATDCTLTSMSIRKVGGTTTVALTNGALTDVGTTLAADAELKGATTYELVAVVAGVNDGDAALQMQLADVTTDVTFLSKTAGTALTYMLPNGVTKEMTIATK